MNFRHTALFSLFGLALSACDPAIDEDALGSTTGTSSAGETSASPGSTGPSDPTGPAETGGEPGSTSATGSTSASATGDAESSDTGTTEGALMSDCNPLDPPDDCLCLLFFNEAFICAPAPPPDIIPPEEGCASVSGCPDGYACVGEPQPNLFLIDDGECVPLCDINAPECPEGLSCGDEFPDIEVGYCS